MLIGIHIKFHEAILNSFQVIERTGFCVGQKSKGNNSKSINASYGFAVCTPNVDLYLHEVS